jgi:hypothetical protein
MRSRQVAAAAQAAPVEVLRAAAVGVLRAALQPRAVGIAATMAVADTIEVAVIMEVAAIMFRGTIQASS